MRVLVLGSGGREHAIVEGLLRDPGVTEVHSAPGNAGTAQIVTNHQVDINDGAAVVALAQQLAVDLVVIGPEVPLVHGVADATRSARFATFGPSAQAAQIEGSKAFAKAVMAAAKVNTARAETVTEATQIDDSLTRFGPHYVVKDDGLAAGKGVVVTEHLGEAKAHALAVIESGNPVLLESYLVGPEVSLFCLVDGATVVPLLPAQDHKRVGDGDTGPNTGGMGAYAPLPWLPQEMVDRIVREVVSPVACEMVNRGTPFNGLLYAGLAIGPEGPSVVEFNCRFGDPETQAVLALLETPLGEVLNAVATGTLESLPPLRWRQGSAVVVVLAAENYPGTPVLGASISGADQPGVFHAGTAAVDTELVSSGGRVLGVVGVGDDLAAARRQAYERIGKITLAGAHYRTDIGAAALVGEISF